MVEIQLISQFNSVKKRKRASPVKKKRLKSLVRSVLWLQRQWWCQIQLRHALGQYESFQHGFVISYTKNYDILDSIQLHSQLYTITDYFGGEISICSGSVMSF
jgi:hypothetical protein